MYKFLFALLVAALPMRNGRAEFIALGLPGSQLAALSADGCTAVGNVSGDGAAGFRWSVGAEVKRLEAAISVRALSASGRYAAGSSLDAERREVASYWDADGRLHRLGGAPGVDAISVVSQAFGITDQPRVVGSVGSAASAFMWSPEVGLRVLAAPNADAAARAQGVSDDGATIYGWSEAKNGQRHGAIWSQGKPRLLLDRSGASVREIVAANRSADVLIGALDEHHDHAAYHWTADGGVQPVLPAQGDAQPLHLFASSADGRVLVGSAGEGNARRAMLWTADAGLQPLDRWLSDRGVAVPRDWHLSAVTAITGDGQRMAGWGMRDGRFDSFVLDVSAQETFSRACDVAASLGTRRQERPAHASSGAKTSGTDVPRR